MTTRETIIELHIPMPEGRVEEAKAVILADELEQSIRAQAVQKVGEHNFSLTSRTLTRKPGAGRPKKNGAEIIFEAASEKRRRKNAEPTADAAVQ